MQSVQFTFNSTIVEGQALTDTTHKKRKSDNEVQKITAKAILVEQTYINSSFKASGKKPKLMAETPNEGQALKHAIQIGKHILKSSKGSQNHPSSIEQQHHSSDKNKLKGLSSYLPQLLTSFPQTIQMLRGQNVCIIEFNKLINSLVDIQQITQAQLIFDQLHALEDPTLWPDLYTYGSLIKGYCEKGDFETIKKLMATMEKDGLKPNLVIYNTLLNGYFKVGNLEEVANTISKIQKDGLESNKVTYGTLLIGYCRFNRMTDAMQVFSQMRSAGIQLKEKNYMMLLKSHLYNKNPHEAIKILKEIKNPLFKLKPKIFGSIIKSFCLQDQPVEAELFMREYSGHCQPVLLNYQELIATYYKTRATSEISRLFQRMRAEQIKPDVTIYNTLIDLYGFEGNLEKVEKLIASMADDHIKPNTDTLFMVIRLLTEAGKCQEAMQILILTNNLNRGLKLSPNLYILIIKGYLRKQQFSEAYDLFVRMNEDGLNVSDSEYQKLLKEVH